MSFCASFVRSYKLFSFSALTVCLSTHGHIETAEIAQFDLSVVECICGSAVVCEIVLLKASKHILGAPMLLRYQHLIPFLIKVKFVAHSSPLTHAYLRQNH